ncbi:MAG TPA: hypothetical protein VNB22_21690 [Pyrinomonadaceae bacterium]|nr:hypothetical protein [Pyrinomonadaceae bacterium]
MAKIADNSGDVCAAFGGGEFVLCCLCQKLPFINQSALSRFVHAGGEGNAMKLYFSIILVLILGLKRQGFELKLPEPQKSS